MRDLKILYTLYFLLICVINSKKFMGISGSDSSIRPISFSHAQAFLFQGLQALNFLSYRPNSFTGHPCIDLVIKILKSSPEYISKTKGLKEAIVANGGISFELIVEGSPNPERDQAWNYSETYDFAISELYSDRSPVIARFSFNPFDGKLYEVTSPELKYNSIRFDRKLLSDFRIFCQ